MTLQRALETHLSRYRHKYDGAHDLLWAFRLIGERFGCRRVLYLGSYLHITPSLVFPEICYVDSVKGISRDMEDLGLLEYVNSHGEPADSFDLLISLNAGFISQNYGHWLKASGYVMANNGHCGHRAKGQYAPQSPAADGIQGAAV